MSLTYNQAAEIVRGRLNMLVSAKLRIQKSVASALQIFSERVAMDENKRHIILTPRSVVGTPAIGLLDLSALVTSNGIMVDKLHLGRLYNTQSFTFLPADVESGVGEGFITITGSNLPPGTRVQFTTTGVLPSPLALVTNYYIGIDGDSGIGQFNLLTDPNDPDSIVFFSTPGTGIHTLIVQVSIGDIPLNELTNPDLTAFPVAWMNQPTDKFWWLTGNILNAFKGDGTPITTPIQFNVPHTVTLAEFGTSSPIGSLQDEFIDTLVEIVRDAEAKRDNPE